MTRAKTGAKIGFILGLIGLIALTVPVRAQPTGGIYLSPTIFEETLNPDETVELTVKVANHESAAMTLHPIVCDFTADPGEGGQPKFLEPGERTETYSLANWVKLSESELRFEAGERKYVKFTIEVPKDAEPGGHYAAIVFSTEPSSPQQGIAATAQIGTLLLVRVTGEIIDERGKIVEFSTPLPRLEVPPVEFVTRIENLGNVHFKPTGIIEIFNGLGKKEATLQLNPTFGNVLPQSIRRFENTWEPESKLLPRMGKYTARLLVIIGTETQTLGAETTFWIIPFWFLIKTAIVLVVCFDLTRKGIKRYNRWIIARAQKSQPPKRPKRSKRRKRKSSSR